MASAVLLTVCILGGIALGRLLPARKGMFRLCGWLQSIALYSLMFLMGLRLQSDPNIWRQMGVIGLQAILLSLATVGGSVLFVWIFQHVYLRLRRMDLYGDGSVGADEASSPLKSLLFILAFIALGVLAGCFGGRLMPVSWLQDHNGTAVDGMLCVMVISSGVPVGQKKGLWKDIKNSGWALLAVPLCVLAGSMIFPFLLSPLLGLRPIEAVGCGAGCGWYSLSGVLMAELRPELGALGLISNLLREMMALGVTPFVAAKLGPMVAVAPGGATTMDVTLPVVVRSTNPGNAILAFANGLILTMVIPFVLRFLLSLA